MFNCQLSFLSTALIRNQKHIFELRKKHKKLALTRETCGSALSPTGCRLLSYALARLVIGLNTGLRAQSLQQPKREIRWSWHPSWMTDFFSLLSKLRKHFPCSLQHITSYFLSSSSWTTTPLMVKKWLSPHTSFCFLEFDREPLVKYKYNMAWITVQI